MLGMDLPPFASDGLLPVGDYPMTIPQLRESHLVTGIYSISHGWDAAWRRHLVDNLEILASELWQE